MIQHPNSRRAAEVQNLPTMELPAAQPKATSRTIKKATGAQKAAIKPTRLTPAQRESQRRAQRRSDRRELWNSYPTRPGPYASDEDFRAYTEQRQAWEERARAYRAEGKIVALKRKLKRNAEEDIIKASDIDDSADEDAPDSKKRRKSKPRWVIKAEEEQQKRMQLKE